MDYEDIFEPENLTASINESIYVYHPSGREIALECLKFLTCFIGTGVDLLMVFIILKYKNMKKPLNIYIMNWLICDALFIFADPAEYRLYTFASGLEAEKEVLCIMFTCILIVRTLAIMFMILLLFQWFLERTKIDIFQNHCYKIVAGVWISAFIEFLTIAISCHYEIQNDIYGAIFAAFLMFFLLICLLIIQCMRHCSNPFTDSTSLSIALITSFILSWLCIIIISLLFYMVSRTIFIVFFYTGQIFVYSYPLIMFYLFYKLDPMFAVCVRILFNMTRPEEANTTFEELDENIDYEESPAII